MEITIRLPESIEVNSYKGLKGYLKQFELAIHHAQKAVENAENSGVEITEDCYVAFEHPFLEKEGDFDPINYFDELQGIDLKISLK